MAETLVPQFADHCFIDLFQGDKLIRRAQIHARGWTPPPGTWARVGEQINYPEGHFCQQAMARRDAVVVEDLVYDEFPAPSQRAWRPARRWGSPRSSPRRWSRAVSCSGVMSLALSRLTEREEQRYDAEDRDFLGAVASRVAIAIDNAMLFEEERRTALAFQTSLLPQVKPTFDGLEVAWRYVPAKPLETHGQGIQTQVGGDWYDLIPLSAGRVGIVIGDVEGRGARAAAIMGQLRAALRAFAQDDKPPAEILRKLDDWCRTLGTPRRGRRGAFDPPLASCTYLVYDAWSRTLSFANAGHDAPLLITDGDVGELEIEHKGVLLGVRGKGMPALPPYREETRQLQPGSTLVLYTDGLTDRRQRADGSGHYTEAEARQMLRSAVRASPGPRRRRSRRRRRRRCPATSTTTWPSSSSAPRAEDLASGRPGSRPSRSGSPRRAARPSSPSPAGACRVSRPSSPACSSRRWSRTSVLHTSLPQRPPPDGTRARGRAAPGRRPARPRLVSGWGTDEYGNDYPGRPAKRFTLRLRRGAAAVWVEVFDTDMRLPRIRSAAETDEGGRGLYLVDQLATRWGSRPTRDGKAVWFEVRDRPRAGRPLLSRCWAQRGQCPAEPE